LRSAFLEHLHRPPPRQFLRVVDLAQVEYMPLRHALPGDPRVLDNAPIAVLASGREAGSPPRRLHMRRLYMKQERTRANTMKLLTADRETRRCSTSAAGLRAPHGAKAKRAA